MMKKSRLFITLGILLCVAAVALFVLIYIGKIHFFLAGWTPWILLSFATSSFALAEKYERSAISLCLQLAVLASADGNISDEEMKLMMMFAKHEGVSQKRLQKELLKLGKEGKYEIVFPEKIELKKYIISALVGMMMVDGQISDSERAIVNDVADKMKLSRSIIDNIIEEIKEKLQ